MTLISLQSVGRHAGASADDAEPVSCIGQMGSRALLPAPCRHAVRGPASRRPYYLGQWLGDGTRTQPSIDNKQERPTIELLKRYAHHVPSSAASCTTAASKIRSPTSACHSESHQSLALRMLVIVDSVWVPRPIRAPGSKGYAHFLRLGAHRSVYQVEVRLIPVVQVAVLVETHGMSLSVALDGKARPRGRARAY